MESNQILVRLKKTLKNQLKNYRGMELKMERSEVHSKGHILDSYGIYLFWSALRCMASISVR